MATGLHVRVRQSSRLRDGHAFRSGAFHGAALAVAVCLTAASCGIYRADSITSRVVDAETGAPIVGANVVAAWKTYGGLEDGNVKGFVQVLETTTDRDGTFHFPEWGPRINTNSGTVRNVTAPLLMILAEGYKYRAVGNGGTSGTAAPTDMKSVWNAKDIGLQRFHEITSEYAQALPFLETDVSLLRSHGESRRASKFLCAFSSQMEDWALRAGLRRMSLIEDLRRDGVSCRSN
jgi:hypothetical protein